MKLLPITLALLVSSGLSLVQTTAAQPQGPVPPAQAPQQASGQPSQPPDGDDKNKDRQTEDIGTGYRRVAGQKREAWLKLERETLPTMDELGKKPCPNEKVIAKRIEAVRAAAREFTAAYRIYLATWSEYTLKDIEESKKFWADMAARQTDIPGSIKNEEEALKEYQRRRANLAADDEKTREILDEVIAKSTAKLEELRSGEGFVAGIDKNVKLSQEYWDMKLESIKKDSQLLEATQNNYESRYDAIIQQWHTVCTGTTKPSTLDDLNLKKK